MLLFYINASTSAAAAAEPSITTPAIAQVHLLTPPRKYGDTGAIALAKELESLPHLTQPREVEGEEKEKSS